MIVVKGLPEISEERYEKIKAYSWKKVNPQTFRNQETWEDLKDIVLYHPNPIVRHEASFIVGDYNIIELVPALIEAVKHDPSIVAKHEAAEALGFIKGPTAKQCYDFLKDIIENPQNYDKEVSHPDVIATAEAALGLLEEEIKTL